MALIKKPHELQITDTVRALIYGQPGIGKTTLGLSAPSPLLIDTDRGIHRIAAEHLKDTVQVSAWQDILDLLKEDLSEYKTLVIDTAGKAIDFLTIHICKEQPRLMQTDGTLSLKGYGVRKQAFSNFITHVTSLGKNIIFIAHEREEKDGDNRYIRPEIGGSSGNDLMKDLDLVGYVESFNNKRTISFNATDKFYGKNTAKLPPRIEIPDYTGNSEPVFMQEILNLYVEFIMDKQKLSLEYNALLDVIEENIDGVVDMETANEVAEKLKTMQHIWDSKLRAAYKLNTKAAELNLRWNKALNTYEPINSSKK